MSWAFEKKKIPKHLGVNKSLNQKEKEFGVKLTNTSISYCTFDIWVKEGG